METGLKENPLDGLQVHSTLNMKYGDCIMSHVSLFMLSLTGETT